MGKEKKQLNPAIVEDSIAYGVITVLAIIGSSFLLFFALIFMGVFPNVLSLLGFSKPFLLGAVEFLVIASATIFIAFKNGQILWAQWQRKLAINEEEKRVARLIDENVVMESRDDLLETPENVQTKKS